MSDLTATNCGGGCNNRCDCDNGNSCIWIILILLLYSGNGFGGGCNNDCGNNGLFGGDCSCIIIIILLLCCCGGGNGFGFGGCGC